MSNFRLTDISPVSGPGYAGGWARAALGPRTPAPAAPRPGVTTPRCLCGGRTRRRRWRGNTIPWSLSLWQVNYKARLEHKQYLAQESPEPIYDISECALKNVPSGVYSRYYSWQLVTFLLPLNVALSFRCKIARKEALLLQVLLPSVPPISLVKISHHLNLLSW